MWRGGRARRRNEVNGGVILRYIAAQTAIFRNASEASRFSYLFLLTTHEPVSLQNRASKPWLAYLREFLWSQDASALMLTPQTSSEQMAGTFLLCWKSEKPGREHAGTVLSKAQTRRTQVQRIGGCNRVKLGSSANTSDARQKRAATLAWMWRWFQNVKSKRCCERTMEPHWKRSLTNSNPPAAKRSLASWKPPSTTQVSRQRFKETIHQRTVVTDICDTTSYERA